MRSNSKQSPFLQPWHVDCRLSKELPDDKPIRVRFLAGAFVGTLAAAALTYALWGVYSRQTLITDIGDWRRRIDANGSEMTKLTAIGAAVSADANRIDEVYGLIHSPLVVSKFVEEAGRTRPAPVRIDLIEFKTADQTSAATIYLRGGLNESSQRASLLLGQYVADLRASVYFRQTFAAITLTSLDRNDQTGAINFEITLRLKGSKS